MACVSIRKEERKIMARYLRNIKDGFIYDWNPILAENPMCEEVTEEEAFPENFVPKAQKGRKSALKLDTPAEEIPETPAVENEELNAEASKGLPE
jgi:hypothetical protein